MQADWRVLTATRALALTVLASAAAVPASRTGLG